MNGQNKKLNPERKIRPGLAWWIYIAKKILAVNAGGKVMKKKPAMRDLLTAGVGGSDEIVVRWPNTVWKEFINPKSKGTLSKKRITGSGEIHLIVFTTRFSAFCFLMSHFYKKR